MPTALCEHCTAQCCRYIALPIDTPTEPRDFDDIRWYLIHEGVSLFVEDGTWYVAVQTRCRHLQPDNRCGIYETRPRVCREYATDQCEYHGGDYNFEHHFLTPEDIDDYVRAARRRKGGAAGRRTAGTASRRSRPRLVVVPRSPSRAPAAADARGVPLPILDLGS